MNTVKSF
ncbi:hypothetical protein BFJ71_g12316, partial [Fusarium oxysporum]